MARTVNAVVSKALPVSLSGLFTQSPAYTRLEPQSITGDPTPGLEARLHDALWMLTRQWQLGEFEGEDNGSPLVVQVNSETSRVTAWQPGDPSANRTVRSLPAGLPLDPFVEREATPIDFIGLRERAEAGAYLVELLADAGLDARAKLIAACPLPVAPVAVPAGAPAAQTALPASIVLMAAAAPDGDAASRQLDAAGTPAWLVGAPPKALDAAKKWLTWYRNNINPVIDPKDNSWIPERLEYRFSIRLGGGDKQTVLRAPAFGGGFVDWYDFDVDPAGKLAVPGETEIPVSESRELFVFASPLRYSGMPSDRYWQFEDGQVNLGGLEVQPFDLGRLCLAEFALIYGNDWMVIPLDVIAGSFTTLSKVAYTNTFGEQILVPLADDTRRTGRFRMFEISGPGDDRAIPGLFVPPTALGSLEGKPLEDLMFLRDEMATMAWAVERFVQGRSGDPRNRGDEERPVNPVEGLEPGAEFQYLLETAVPLNWIPLVPVATGIGTFNLRKGTMHDTDSSLGLLLHATPLDIRDEEIPRSGIRLRRIAALARVEDGHYIRWITRRTSLGRGEGSSGLAFDSALLPG